MIKYWKKNRLWITFLESVLSASLISLIFVSPNISNIAISYNEQSFYTGTGIDFDVPSPSKNQVIELEELDHIEKAIPYIYTNKTVNYDSSKTLSNVGVMFLDTFDMIELTMYNPLRLIERNDNYSDNPLVVDYRFVKTTGLDLGDLVQINFAGSFVQFTIDAIYETNSYYQSNVVLGIWSGQQKTLTESNLGKELNYSGAYIVSNEISVTDYYLRTEYKPYGRLRDRSEFDSDESYQIHYDAFMSGNYSNEITSFETLFQTAQDKVENFKQIALVNLFSGAFILLLIQAFFSFALVFRKSEIKYFKSKKLLGASYTKYFIFSFAFELLFSIPLLVLFPLVFWFMHPLYLPFSQIIGTISVLIASAILASILSFFGSNFVMQRVS